MSAADLSVAMLKKSLEANGLASYGTKEEMLERLLAGGGKKKPGPKSKAVPKKKDSKTSASKTSASKTKGAQIKLPQPLDAAQACKCALKLVGTESSPSGISFVYEPITSTTTKGVKVAKPAKALKAQPSKTKSKRDRDESDSDDSDDEMEWACDVTVKRLLKKAKKEHIALLCGDFGVGISGTKQELSENLAEQLHYETDSDDEEEDDEE